MTRTSNIDGIESFVDEVASRIASIPATNLYLDGSRIPAAAFRQTMPCAAIMNSCGSTS